MAYRNAQEIFPEGLLKQIQRYVSGETIYIPAGEERKAWGETSGYQRYIRERNEEIRSGFAAGLSIEELMDKYALSGRNIPFSDGLKLFDRYYFSPAEFPVSLFRRCAGPEEEMKYRIDKDWWEQRVAGLEKSI